MKGGNFIMSKKVYTVVYMYQGLIDTVDVCISEQEAEKRFETYTGISWLDYQGDNEILNGRKEEQTNIYVTDIIE
jgi:hypothetical protein